MIQDLNPMDDPEMESFCEWLYTEGFANQMAFDKLKEVWLRGRKDYYGYRLSRGDYFPSQEEYKLLTYLFRKSTEQLHAHLQSKSPNMRICPKCGSTDSYGIDPNWGCFDCKHVFKFSRKSYKPSSQAPDAAKSENAAT